MDYWQAPQDRMRPLGRPISSLLFPAPCDSSEDDGADRDQGENIRLGHANGLSTRPGRNGQETGEQKTPSY